MSAVPSGKQSALTIASHSTPGIGWSIPEEWAKELVEEHHLELKCGAGDITGESHALFKFRGETIRLKKDWMGHYQLFHGVWQHDPHFTGD